MTAPPRGASMINVTNASAQRCWLSEGNSKESEVTKLPLLPAGSVFAALTPGDDGFKEFHCRKQKCLVKWVTRVPLLSIEKRPFGIALRFIDTLERGRVVPCAPWRIRREALETEAVQKVVASDERCKRVPHACSDANAAPPFSTT
jgi:hypothetical protein